MHLINTVLEGDCLKILNRISNESIDMILCDLSYGSTQNKWDKIIDLQKLWEQYERIIKPNAVIVLNSQGRFTSQLIQSNLKLFKYKLVWVKSKPTNFLNVKKQPLRKHEDICIFSKGQPCYNSQISPGIPYSKGIRNNKQTGSYGVFHPILLENKSGRRYPIDVIYFPTAESEGPVWHSTQKPVALARYLIRTYSNPGNLILDNACGSGSYLVAAVLENRNFIGIEKNDYSSHLANSKTDYIAISKRRVQEALLSVDNPNED